MRESARAERLVPKAPGIPPFATLLKSRDVEDPVNLWVHRPLAYGFVQAVYGTRLTPNQVTFLAMLVGMTAGGLWLYGTPGAMVAGGILLWASAILDGADGILARAKNMQSQFGRALDGSADMIVAICTVLPGIAHLWMKHHDGVIVIVAVVAILGTLPHLYLYDFYKESYLRMTRLRGGEGDDVDAIEQRLEQLRSEHGSLIVRLAVKFGLIPFLLAQKNLIRLTNRAAMRMRGGQHWTLTSAEVYRRNNLGPMRLWAWISLCPHSYLMAIFAMFDRLDAYIWLRLIGMNVLFAIVVVWQRRATERSIGLGSEPPSRHPVAIGRAA